MPLWARPAAAAGPPTQRARPVPESGWRRRGARQGAALASGSRPVERWCRAQDRSGSQVNSALPKPGECGPFAAQTRERAQGALVAGRVRKGTFTQVGARDHGARRLRLRPGGSYQKKCVRVSFKARWPQVSLDSWFPIFSPPPRLQLWW